jgi:NAD(P)-dependent dehydrogenase (short-subunit alcohol dehydrogenase family)
VAETHAEIMGKGIYDVFTKLVDVSSDDEVKTWVQETVDKWGKIDILVNNAAVFVFGSVQSASAADWDKVLSVNVKVRCPRYPGAPWVHHALKMNVYVNLMLLGVVFCRVMQYA